MPPPPPTTTTPRTSRVRAIYSEEEEERRRIKLPTRLVTEGGGGGGVTAALRQRRCRCVNACVSAGAVAHDSGGRWCGAMARGPAVYRSRLIVQLRRVWGVHFARVNNARLKLACVYSAQGRGLPTAAGRGRSHTARARVDTDSNFHGQFGVRLPHRRARQRPLRRLNVNGVFPPPTLPAARCLRFAARGK